MLESQKKEILEAKLKYTMEAKLKQMLDTISWKYTNKADKNAPNQCETHFFLLCVLESLGNLGIVTKPKFNFLDWVGQICPPRQEQG